VTGHAARREYALGLALCLAGAALLLIAAGRPWSTLVAEAAPGLPRSTVVRTGRDVAPLAAAAGVAGLAAVAGVVATRGWARRAVGGLAALFGLAAALAPRSAADGGDLGPILSERTSLWAAASVIGGTLLLAGGLLAAARGHRWPAMGRRYDAPAAARYSSADRVRDGGGDGGSRDVGELWAAIDRGDDPTITPPKTPPDRTPPERP
jgi:uncharacterized membrane protein (TIGR02234 family)